MMGIFTLGSWPLPMMQHHVAFQVRLEDVLAAPQRLPSAGITPRGPSRLGVRGDSIDEPIVFAWMPAASIFFDDRDGNLLEFVSMLPEPSRPELGLLSLSEWRRIHEHACWSLRR